MKFQVKLTQVNNKGHETFRAIANNINVGKDGNLKDLCVELTEFTKDTILLHSKLTELGVKGLSKQRIKNSQAMNFELVALEDETTVSFAINNFGKFATNSTKDKLNEVITLIAQHNDKFAYLWS